jgi:hypothetical protein
MLRLGEDLLDTSTRLRARVGVGYRVVGGPYFWSTWPDFVQECLERLRRILSDPDGVSRAVDDSAPAERRRTPGG